MQLFVLGMDFIGPLGCFVAEVVCHSLRSGIFHYKKMPNYLKKIKHQSRAQTS